MIKKKISRRSFLSSSLAAGVSMALPMNLLSPRKGYPASDAPKVILLSIDALDPRYLDLDQEGRKGGSPGNYLMPNVRALVDSGVLFDRATCHLPSATDMNHVNALAGTCSEQTGIFGVSLQPVAWGADGKIAAMAPPDLYSRGADRPVDTLFAAWKRAYGNRSRTLYASGKEWVGRMFDVEGSGVDMVLGGSTRRLFIPGRFFPMVFKAPEAYSFYDPPSDANSLWDHTSFYQKTFCRMIYEKNPENFPSDQWMVENTLRVLRTASPDLSVLVLGQMDDLQHGLGTAYPEDFNRPIFSGLSSVNAWVCREAVLDGIRDVDVQVGRFMNGLADLPEYRDAVIVLYSDHGHVTHRDTVRANIGPLIETDPTAVLKRYGFLTDDEEKGIGYYAYTASSYGGLYFKGHDRHLRAEEAAGILKNYTVKDYFPDGSCLGTVCPWRVLTLEDMVSGIPEQGILPKELYHKSAENQDLGLWPDVMLFLNNGWQLPITGGLAANLGVSFMASMPPLTTFLGGHGSLDTRNIVMAFSGPGIASGRVVHTPCKISDIALTLKGLLGMDEPLFDASDDPDIAWDRSGNCEC